MEQHSHSNSGVEQHTHSNSGVEQHSHSDSGVKQHTVTQTLVWSNTLAQFWCGTTQSLRLWYGTIDLLFTRKPRLDHGRNRVTFSPRGLSPYDLPEIYSHLDHQIIACLSKPKPAHALPDHHHPNTVVLCEGCSCGSKQGIVMDLTDFVF